MVAAAPHVLFHAFTDWGELVEDKARALDGVRVVDLTDERGIYGAKLLSDLGADVVRIEPPGGDPLRRRGPHAQEIDPEESSLYYAFFATNRRSFVVDVNEPHSIEQLRALVARADIVLSCRGAHGVEHIGDELKRDDLVWVDLSSFGDEGPWQDYLAPDFVAGALGGSIATTGAADTSPLKTFGELNFMVVGAYVAIAALSALNERHESKQGQRVGVSAHECIASCLEQVFMFYWYHELMEREQVLPRRGSTHWSNAFTVMNGKNGGIMITPTPDMDRQLAWLIEEDAHGDMLDEKYQDPANLPLIIGRMMQLLAEWVSQKDVEALFYEAQERHMSYGWVQPLARVSENPQLRAREWFRKQNLGGREVEVAGPPYNLSDSDWRIGDAVKCDADREAVLREIGWEASA